MSTRTDESAKFDHRRAASLIFPERSLTDTFRAKFQDDKVLVSVRMKYHLYHLLNFYQQAYFDEKMGDANWLKSVAPNIVKMCTEGCVPYVNFSDRTEWTPEERDFKIPLQWLGQAVKLEFCDRIGKDYYYEASIEATEGSGVDAKHHSLGTRVLVGLGFSKEEFAQYRLKHIFENLGYQSRWSIPVSKEGDASFERLKETVEEIADEVLGVFGEKGISAPSGPSGRDGFRIRINQLSERSGSVNAAVFFKMFTSGEGARKAREIDVGFEIEHNRFSENRALSQLRGVEAMNLFLVKLRRLKRDVESE